MVFSTSSHSVPWYFAPRREFPAQQWAEQRFPFRVPPLHLARYLRLGERKFPAKKWVEQRTVGRVAVHPHR